MSMKNQNQVSRVHAGQVRLWWNIINIVSYISISISNMYLLLLSGFIVTGGHGAKRSVELIDLASNTQRHCTFGDLPDDRYYHTQV